MGSCSQHMVRSKAHVITNSEWVVTFGPESFVLAFEPRFYHCSRCRAHLIAQKMKWLHSTAVAVLVVMVVAVLSSKFVVVAV